MYNYNYIQLKTLLQAYLFESSYGMQIVLKTGWLYFLKYVFWIIFK